MENTFSLYSCQEAGERTSSQRDGEAVLVMHCCDVCTEEYRDRKSEFEVGLNHIVRSSPVWVVQTWLRYSYRVKNEFLQKEAGA